jgi:hypothetical protein
VAIDVITAAEGSDSGTSATITYPSGIASGDLCICVLGIDGDGVVSNWDVTDDWTPIRALSHTGGDCGIFVAWREIDTTEGATFDVALDSNEATSWVIYRITGMVDPSTTPPDCSTGAEGDSIYPNPDSHSPGGGSGTYLWIAACCQDRNRAYVSSPTDYNDDQYQQTGGAAGSVHVAVATRTWTGATQDPGVFEFGTGDEWVACTIAVPEGAAGETVQIGKATIALVGQALNVNAAEDITVTKGSIALVGQNVVSNMEEVITVTKGAIALAAKAVNVNIKETITVTKGTIALVGQPVLALGADVVVIAKAAISAVGQAVNVNIKEAVTITKGAIALAGQAFTVIEDTIVTITKGTISLVGKALGVNEGAVALKRIKTWLYYYFRGR